MFAFPIFLLLLILPLLLLLLSAFVYDYILFEYFVLFEMIDDEFVCSVSLTGSFLYAY